MSTRIGTGNLFGLADVTAVSIAGLCQLTHIQSLEVSEESDEEPTKDGNGNTKVVNKYDLKRKATIEFVHTSGSTADAVVTSYPSIGATISIANTTFIPIAGAWVVDNLNWSRGNTRSLMGRISLTRYIDGAIP